MVMVVAQAKKTKPIATITVTKLTAQCLRSAELEEEDDDDGFIFAPDEMLELPNGILFFPAQVLDGKTVVRALFLEGRERYMPGDETEFTRNGTTEYPIADLLRDLANANPKPAIVRRIKNLIGKD